MKKLLDFDLWYKGINYKCVFKIKSKEILWGCKHKLILKSVRLGLYSLVQTELSNLDIDSVMYSLNISDITKDHPELFMEITIAMYRNADKYLGIMVK